MPTPSVTKRKKKQTKRRPKPAAASRRRALAERWAALADAWLDAGDEEARDGCVAEARSLALEDGSPHAFGQAFSRAGPSRAEALLALAAAAEASQLAPSLTDLLERPLAAGLALRAAEALGACGSEVGEDFTQVLAQAKEAADTLAETLKTTGDPEAITQAVSPLEALAEGPAVSCFLEVFVHLSPDGWMGTSRLAGLSPSLDSVLVLALDATALPGAEAVPLLQRLAQSDTKATAKRARALLHKLKSRGVDVDEGESPAVWSLPPAESGPGEALATGFDPAGHRLVWLALPAPGRGLHVGYGVIDDAAGLLSFSWGSMTRKQLGEVKEELAGEHAKRKIPIVELAPNEAALRLAEAAARSEAAGREVPEDYRAFERLHPPPPGQPTAAIYEAMPPETIERARHSTSATPSLLDDPEAVVGFWPVEAEAVARSAEPAGEGRIIIAPSPPQAPEAEETEAACDRLFAGELLERLLARMEEQAFVFWADGQHERATLCLACVLPLRDDPLLKPSAHPFWRLWAERLLQAHRQESQREQASGRLIVTPEEAAAEAEAARRRLRPGRPKRS
ncbi:MAG: hypothetical protein RX318_06510 [bacterium]|nr:hypothetical protein [bacterium]